MTPADPSADRLPATLIRMRGDDPQPYVGFVGVVGTDVILSVPFTSRTDAGVFAATVTNATIELAVDLSDEPDPDANGTG